MPSKIPDRDPIAKYQRERTAARRIGKNRKCACGEARAKALVPESNPTICAECQRKTAGKSIEDGHHPYGRANDPTTIVPIPVNDHRARLSSTQHDWPKKTLENPDGSPLLAGAARVRGFVDTVVYLIEKGLLWLADMLETLDEYLAKILGPRWWDNTELQSFAPRR